jgi:transketolase
MRRMKRRAAAHFAQVAVDAAVAAHTKAETVASRKASQIALEAFTGAARAAGRQRRPDRLQPDQHQASTPALRFDAAGKVVPNGRPPHQLRRARVRHGRHHERRGAARRLHPLRRHLPDLQRLQPQRHPHGRADEAARDPCVHARQHRPGRRRPHAPERGARRQPAPDPNLDVWRPADTAETAVAWAVALPTRTQPSALLLSRQNLPYAKAQARPGRHQRAPTCWPSRPRWA